MIGLVHHLVFIPHLGHRVALPGDGFADRNGLAPRVVRRKVVVPVVSIITSVQHGEHADFMLVLFSAVCKG